MLKKGADTMKKMITAAALIVVTLMMSVTSFAGSSITEKEAVKIALKSAGLGRAQVTRLESEYEHGKYEVEFVRRSNKAEYEFDLSKTGRILEKSVDYRYKKDHSHDKIGKAEARKKVAKFSGISLKVIKTGTCVYEYDDDDREGTYEVKFRRGSYKYDYEVLAPTGKVIEYSKKYVK